MGTDSSDHINYCDATSQAWSEGNLADDIMTELSKLTAADLVIFQFPLQWSSVPAILKGWFDKILVMRYAFTDMEMFDCGKLKASATFFKEFKCTIKMTMAYLKHLAPSRPLVYRPPTSVPKGSLLSCVAILYIIKPMDWLSSHTNILWAFSMWKGMRDLVAQ